MIALKYDKDYLKYDKEDLDRIRRLLNEHGYDMMVWDCHLLWSRYSDKACANWLYLPKEDEKLWVILEEELKNVQVFTYVDLKNIAETKSFNPLEGEIL